MKKILNMLLVFTLILGLFTSFTTDIAAAETLSFVHDYEKTGVPIEVDTSALSGDLAYSWSVGGKVVSTEATYTPTESDSSKFISVTVTCNGTEYVASTFFSALPVVYIDIENGATVTSKDYYLNSELTIQGNDEYNSSTTKLYSGASEIKGRGNSTWGLPKKPYRLKLDKGTNLFGFGKSKHWVLLANYYDTTFLRNKLGYDLSGDMGIPYMQSILVDVVMNGEYVGNYQFCEHIRVDDERIEVTDWESLGEDAASAIVEANGLTDDDLDALEPMMAEDFSWIDTDTITYNNVTYKVSDFFEYPDITGGYLMEMDTNYDEISKFKTDDNVPMMFKAPEYANTSDTMMNYVKTYIQAFEDSVKSSNYTVTHEDTTKHYSELFDVDSLVDNWIIQELVFNEDFMKKSTYMYKDHGELFKMGPIWDLDWASGAEQSAAKAYDKWQTTYFNADCQSDQWYKYLVKDPYYLKQVQDRYLEIRETYIKKYMDSIDPLATQIAYSAQASLDMWRSGKNYTSEVNKFTTWMTNRLNFLDSKIADIDTLLDEFDTSVNHLTVNNTEVLQPKYNDETYHYAVDAGSKVTLSQSTKGTDVEVWVNNKKVADVKAENGTATCDVTIEEDSVIQFYSYSNGTLVNRSYITLTTDVKVVNMTGIEFTAPTQTIYSLNEELDMSDASLTVLYDDGTSNPVTEYEVTGYDNTVLGKQTVTVTYKGYTATFEVEVIESQVDIEFIETDIELSVGDSKELTYTMTNGEEDITWIVEDESVVTVIDGKAIALAAGTTKVTALLAGGKSDTLTITVTKTAIGDAGDVIDPSHMSVIAGDEDYRDPAENVLDGDTSTMWHTDWAPKTNNRENHYLIFTLDGEYYVDGMKMLKRQNGTNGVIYGYNLYTRLSDSDEWTCVVQDGKLEGTTDWETVTFDAVKCTQIKLEVTDSQGNGRYIFSSAAEVRFTGYEQLPVDKSVLKELYNTYSAIDTSIYTEESVNDLTKALADALVVLENNDATQDDVDVMVETLINVYNALEEKVVEIPVDKTALQAKVDEVKDTVQGNYTDESWTVYKSALESAETVLANEEATQEEVDNALTVLTDAYANLKEKEVVKPVVIKDALIALYDSLKDITGDNYTEESYAVFKEALDNAKTVIDNEEATQEEVNKALLDLTNAYTGLEEKPEEEPLPFEDVHEYDWYYEWVKEAYNLGLMTGASETLFKPNVKMNRGMVAIVLHRMEGAEPTEFETLFPDVKEGEYYAESVTWAKLNGVINGYGDGTFRPLREVTREEMAQMIYNFAIYKGEDVESVADLTKFLDGDKVSAWHKDAMVWAVDNELISGKYLGTIIDPQGHATRAECAKMLVQAYKAIYK